MLALRLKFYICFTVSRFEILVIIVNRPTFGSKLRFFVSVIL